jgi:pimeloyl-ACP methyl ester carboxylesterase
LVRRRAAWRAAKQLHAFNGLAVFTQALYVCICTLSSTGRATTKASIGVPAGLAGLLSINGGIAPISTLILHGDDDQIVPIQASALLSSKIVKGSILKVYKGAPHGMCTTLKNQVNEELLTFIKA